MLAVAHSGLLLSSDMHITQRLARMTIAYSIHPAMTITSPQTGPGSILPHTVLRHDPLHVQLHARMVLEEQLRVAM